MIRLTPQPDSQTVDLAEVLRRADQATVYDMNIERLLRSSAEGVAAMREEAERIIATSRKGTQPRLRQALDECQADYLQGDYDAVGSRQSHEWGE